MSENEAKARAEKIVDEKIGFYHHLYSYIVINILFSPDHWWFIWVSFFWGIGLVTHFVRTHIFAEKFDEKYRDRMIEKEMEKMKK